MLADPLESKKLKGELSPVQLKEEKKESSPVDTVKKIKYYMKSELATINESALEQKRASISYNNLQCKEPGDQAPRGRLHLPGVEQ